jgi:hypothetical protein
MLHSTYLRVQCIAIAALLLLGMCFPNMLWPEYASASDTAQRTAVSFAELIVKRLIAPCLTDTIFVETAAL